MSCVPNSNIKQLILMIKVIDLLYDLIYKKKKNYSFLSKKIKYRLTFNIIFIKTKDNKTRATS